MRQVGVDSLKIGDILGKTIYSSKGRILLNQGIKLTPRFISKLREMGISIVYIEDERFSDVVIEDVISEENRREALIDIEKCAQLIRLGKDMNGIKLQTVVKNIVEEILFRKDILVNMIDMRNKSNRMFAHSVNVCVLATVLGKALMFDKEKLETLALGALLHDIGKVSLPPELFEKENLTGVEQEEMKTHTSLGFDFLRRKKEFTLITAHIAFQHHECSDGSGYPRGLMEGEILPLAQIVAVVDLYDNLTSDRIGKKRIMPNEACEVLMGLAVKKFPLEFVRVFLKNIAAYPTGVTVRLSTGEIGVVVDQNLSMPTRPVVRVFEEAEAGSEKGKEYDLVENRTLFITEVLT